MSDAVRIRGIYSTALTQIFLEKNYIITDPSEVIQHRFPDSENLKKDVPEDISIRDIEDQQGIRIEAKTEILSRLRAVFESFLPESIFRQTEKNKNVLYITFPYHSKLQLDSFRREVTPTLKWHHFLRIVCPEVLDALEDTSDPDETTKYQNLGDKLKQKQIWDKYSVGDTVDILHSKVDGSQFDLSPGKIQSWDYDTRTLILTRPIYSDRGKYDGLNADKQKGDYVITSLTEGERFLVHRYFRENDEFIGAYGNVNTGIECYPDLIRYVDLEIDVVKNSEGSARIIEKNRLLQRHEQKYITAELQNTALETAHQLAEKLNSPAK
jgi:hypothetical protein